MNKYQDALNHLIKCDRDSCSHISDAYRNDLSALQELIRKSQQMPTDEKLIEWLRKIKEHCEKHECNKCQFNIKKKYGDYYSCQVIDLFDYLDGCGNPRCWNMEKIERIIKL